MPVFENLKNLIRHKSSSPEPKKPSLPQYKELSPRYIIQEQIGEGAFSKVFKAFDIELNKHVAIKIIEKQAMNKSQIDSVLKEVSIMKRLNHPNIVTILNFINNDSKSFIILELLNGGEIFNKIVELTYFSELLSKHVIIQIVQAIKYLHQEVGVVHRDIKPENLLFDKIPYKPSTTPPQLRKSDESNKKDEGEFITNIGSGEIGVVKLADFGLSKILWDQATTKTPCGTASYTAPEIIKDEAYSKAVDMWGVGCVLYTLLCGFPPFYDNNPEELTKKVARGDYCFLSPWWDEISKEAKDLVSHLLTVDPKKRYTPDDVLNHPWITGVEKLITPAIDAPHFKSSKGLTFEEVIPKVSSGELSPRAEAMKNALDCGISIQRIGTPLRKLVDDYFDEEEENDSDDDDDEEDDSDNDEEDEEDDDSYTYEHTHKYSMSPYHCKRKTNVTRFKEIEGFNLRFDDNTLLNRRKLNNEAKRLNVN